MHDCVDTGNIYNTQKKKKHQKFYCFKHNIGLEDEIYKRGLEDEIYKRCVVLSGKRSFLDTQYFSYRMQINLIFRTV